MWLLRSSNPDGWSDLYAFTLKPQRPIDYAVYNHYTSTHPASPFVGQVVVIRTAHEVRHILAAWSSPPIALTELPSATSWQMASCPASSGSRSVSYWRPTSWRVCGSARERPRWEAYTSARPDTPRSGVRDSVRLPAMKERRTPENRSPGREAGRRAESWWRGAVIYQVYPRSFRDANGDGVGDLRGIVEKLEYLSWLGIDAVWLNPIYPRPWQTSATT